MRSFGKVIGILSGAISICLSVVFIFFNPYNASSTLSGETIAITLMMLLFPAIVAMTAGILNKPFLMLGAFIWALPVSLYVMLTPSIFKLFSITCFLYFISFLLLYFQNGNKRVVKFN